LSGCGVIGIQSGGKVGVNARIRFLGRNCQRKDFLFRQVFEIFLPRDLLPLRTKDANIISSALQDWAELQASQRGGLLFR